MKRSKLVIERLHRATIADPISLRCTTQKRDQVASSNEDRDLLAVRVVPWVLSKKRLGTGSVSPPKRQSLGSLLGHTIEGLVEAESNEEVVVQKVPKDGNELAKDDPHEE